VTDLSLRGRTVAVTRPEPPDGPLAAALSVRGATPVHRPVLEIRPLESGSLTDAVAGLPDVDWLVLTSPRAVSALAGVGVFGSPPPPSLRVAVVGARTAEAVRECGWPVDLVPATAGAAGLVEAFRAAGVREGARVLFPASARARPELPEGLEAMGARVRSIAAYEPVPKPLVEADWTGPDGAPDWDALTFTSPSAVDALTAGLPDRVLRPLRCLPAGVQGPTTGAAVRAAGWSAVVEAEPRTFAGLASALASHLGPSAADLP
jgi:uroporphyrinogen-III synthase